MLILTLSGPRLTVLRVSAALAKLIPMRLDAAKSRRNRIDLSFEVSSTTLPMMPWSELECLRILKSMVAGWPRSSNASRPLKAVCSRG